MNKVDLVVKCRMSPANKEAITVYYVKCENEWVPMPPSICDNGCGSEACKRCIDEVYAKAAAEVPPYLK